MEERDLRSKLEQVFLVGVEHFIDGRIISSSFHQGSRKKDWTSKGPVNEEVMLKHFLLFAFASICNTSGYSFFLLLCAACAGGSDFMRKSLPPYKVSYLVC